MAELMFIGPTETVPGIGRVRCGVITTVPDEMVPELLATGSWETIDSTAAATPERITEVPATKTASKPKRRKA